MFKVAGVKDVGFKAAARKSVHWQKRFVVYRVWFLKGLGLKYWGLGIAAHRPSIVVSFLFGGVRCFCGG